MHTRQNKVYKEVLTAQKNHSAPFEVTWMKFSSASAATVLPSQTCSTRGRLSLKFQFTRDNRSVYWTLIFLKEASSASSTVLRTKWFLLVAFAMTRTLRTPHEIFLHLRRHIFSRWNISPCNFWKCRCKSLKTNIESNWNKFPKFIFTSDDDCLSLYKAYDADVTIGGINALEIVWKPEAGFEKKSC